MKTSLLNLVRQITRRRHRPLQPLDLDLDVEALESRLLLADMNLVVGDNPLDLQPNSDNYEDFAVFGGALVAEGDLEISVDMSTSGVGGLYLLQTSNQRDIALYRDGQHWVVTASANGTPEILMTLTAGLSGVFSLELSNDFNTLTVEAPDTAQQTHQFGSDFFTSGASLETHVFVGPHGTLTIDELSVSQADVSGYESAGLLAPSLDEAAANHGIDFGALPDTWQGTPQHEALFGHHNGLFNWSIGFPDDVADPARSYQRMESQLSYAVANDMRIRGHCLIWHLETPEEYGDGSYTRESLIEVMRDRIQNTISAYPEIDEWIVVNEPVEYDGTLRDSIWRSVIGDDYIELAFQFANEVADADDLLLINEYEVEIPGTPKSAAYLDLVSDLLDNNVAIDGVGIQAHIAIANVPIPTYDDLRATFKKFGDLGTRVHITELDVNTSYMSGTDAEKGLQQAAIYSDVANACIHSGVCDSISTWGMSDPFSWLLDPDLVPTGGEAPLIFDAQFAPKASFQALLTALNNQTPTVVASAESVTVHLGETATVQGTYSDPDGDELTLTASVGSVESNGNGDWTWTFDTLTMTPPPQITITATDPSRAVGTATFDLIVSDFSPTLLSFDSSHNSACESSFDGIISVGGTFSDPGPDTHSVRIDWGDGTSEEFNLDDGADDGADENERSFDAMHTYETGGWFEVTAIVSDSQGHASNSITTQAVVQGIGLVGGIVYVIGTDGVDVVYVTHNHNQGTVVITADLHRNKSAYRRNLSSTFQTSSVSRIISHLCDGKDTYWNRGGIYTSSIDQTVFAGDGSDKVRGGNGSDILNGQGGRDALDGFGGNDVLDGGVENDRLIGGEGDDVVFGQDGNDFLSGDSGNDSLDGGKGKDRLYGGNDNDELYGRDGKDSIFGGAGNDLLDGGADNDRLLGSEGVDVLFGGDGNDDLNGGSEDDTLNGGDGKDLLSGLSGDDSIDGGSGDDRLYGGDGDDQLYGGDGNDRLYGANGDDELHGQNHDDRIYGGSGNDLLDGGTHRDRLFGQNGSDVLLGHDGDDLLYGGADNDALSGGDGRDRLSGSNGDDILIGGKDRDILNGQNGYDILIGDLTDNDGSGLDLRTAIASFSSANVSQVLVLLGPITDDLYLDKLAGKGDYLIDGIGGPGH